ncbi:MAG: T9SS type A sorting domain-containing protein [Calditrichaeota bacterium]|nr:T9SS type A sorting domain-containing protein [Calditrichota bacterium]
MARVINIPDDQETIQAGIDAAEDGDTVLVQPGEYYESINFEGKAITVGSLYLTTRNEVYIDSTVFKDRIVGVRFDSREDENSIFTGFTIYNSSDQHGDWVGEIDIINSSPCINHIVVRGAKGQHTSGIFCRGESNPLISYVTIFDNNSGCWCGGGVKCYDSSSPILMNCTIANNGLESHGCYGLNVHGGNPILINCILWGNNKRQIIVFDTLTLLNCNVQWGLDSISIAENGHLIWDESNFSEDPLFVDLDNDDFCLTEDSPCIDAGDPESDLDPDGTQADMGAYYFHQRDIEVEADELQFDGVQTGTIDSVALVINNVGLTTLRITSMYIEPLETPFYIWWEREFQDIEPETSFTEWVKFAPDAEDEYNAMLTIASDDPDEEVVEVTLNGTALGVTDDEDHALSDFAITSAYPNPFNSETIISYSITQPGIVNLGIYDLSGREITSLYNGQRGVGEYSNTWNAKGIPTGVYVCRLSCNNQFRTEKLVVVR